MKTVYANMTILRLTGEQIDSVQPPLADDWFCDFDEYAEFVPLAEAARLRTALGRIARVARDYQSTDRWGVYPLGLFQMIADECAATISREEEVAE